MKRWTTLLTVVLAVQLAAVAWSLRERGELAARAPDAPLLAVDREAIDGIVIRDGEGHSVRLRHGDGGWRLVEPIAFEADDARVGRLLGTVTGLRKGWAVATSEAALGRFEVTPGKFQRRIELRHGDEVLATLTVGRSAGLRRSYVRAGDEQAVYAVELPVFELGARQTDWLDHTVLQVGEEEIRALTLPGGITVRRVAAEEGAAAAPGAAAQAPGSQDAQAGGSGKAGESAAPAPRFAADGVPEGTPPLDQEAAATLLRRVAELRIVDVLEDEDDSALGLEAPALSFSVTLGGEQGGTRRYDIGKPEGKDWYALRTDARPELFKLSAFVVDGLKEAMKTETLFPPPKAKKVAGKDAVGATAPAVAGDGEPAAPQPSG